MKVYDIIARMSTETVSFWADVAAIFLLSQIIVVSLLFGILSGFGWWQFRKGRKALAMPLLRAQVFALRVQHRTMKAGDAAANVPIQIHALTTRIKTTAQVLARGKAKN